MIQPTDAELKKALGRAMESAGPEYPRGARLEDLYELAQLRNKRTTWFGEAENELRRNLDRYLDHRRHE